MTWAMNEDRVLTAFLPAFGHPTATGLALSLRHVRGEGYVLQGGPAVAASAPSGEALAPGPRIRVTVEGAARYSRARFHRLGRMLEREIRGRRGEGWAHVAGLLCANAMALPLYVATWGHERDAEAEHVLGPTARDAEERVLELLAAARAEYADQGHDATEWTWYEGPEAVTEAEALRRGATAADVALAQAGETVAF